MSKFASANDTGVSAMNIATPPSNKINPAHPGWPSSYSVPGFSLGSTRRPVRRARGPCGARGNDSSTCSWVARAIRPPPCAHSFQ